MPPQVFYMLAGILLIRLIAIFIMGPMPQDAYYFFYASHPSLSYFDHPPAIAWLIRISTGVLGTNPMAIKFGDSLLTAFTSLAVYRLSLRFYPVFQSIKVIVIFLSTLMVSILSLISTPDTPLLFFWTLSLCKIHDAVFKDRKINWIYAGILMGLAFDSKYTAVFLPVGMMLFLLISPSMRKKLFTIWPWLAILIMILVSSPVIIWNFGNGFASFAFQGSKRMDSVAQLQFHPRFIFGLLGHQLALLIPVLFVFLFRSFFLIFRPKERGRIVFSDKNAFLLAFFLPIFLGFLMLSPFYWIKINWMMPAYISGIILASGIMENRWVRIQTIISLVIHAGLLCEIVFYPFPVRSDDTWVGWKELNEKTQMLKKQYKADFIFSADSYKTSAELNLYSPLFVYGQNVIGEHALHFSYIGTDLSVLNGKCAIFLDSQPGFTDLDKASDNPLTLENYFSSIRQLSPIVIYRNAKPVRKFLVYLCHLYRPGKELNAEGKGPFRHDEKHTEKLRVENYPSATISTPQTFTAIPDTTLALENNQR
ncbi:ArnT family glycosyltransferase [Pedobacter suwonensis]|uniref:ArnT family glycosyltransferase n=1 Tax=Pedobacter suwonensis TaxID=332999 RepID=UPI003803B9E1